MNSYNRDNNWLQGYLKLVGIELPIQIIEGWNDRQAIMAADYVWHLLKREELNIDIMLPSKPKFLPQPAKKFLRRISICLIKNPKKLKNT